MRNKFYRSSKLCTTSRSGRPHGAAYADMHTLRLLLLIAMIAAGLVLAAGCAAADMDMVDAISIKSGYSEPISQMLPGHRAVEYDNKAALDILRRGGAIEAYDMQGQDALAEYWYPLTLDTIVIAVDRDQTDMAVATWGDLRGSDVSVSMTDNNPDCYMLSAAISYGLDGEDFSLEAAVELLEPLYQAGKFSLDDAESPIQICFDSDAVARIKNGENVEIVVPSEGTLTYTCGLLSNTPLTLPADTEQILLDHALRLTDTRCDNALYPASEKYASAIILTPLSTLPNAAPPNVGPDNTSPSANLGATSPTSNAIETAPNADLNGAPDLNSLKAHIIAAAESWKPMMRREIYHTHLYTSADGVEHVMFPAFFIVFAVIWFGTMVRRSRQKSVQRVIIYMGILLFCWVLVRIVKYQFSSEDELTRYTWYSFYIFQTLLPLCLLRIASLLGTDEQWGERDDTNPVIAGLTRNPLNPEPSRRGLRRGGRNDDVGDVPSRRGLRRGGRNDDVGDVPARKGLRRGGRNDGEGSAPARAKSRRKGRRSDGGGVAVWFIIVCIVNIALAALVMTNDMHGYMFKLDIAQAGWSSNYSYGFLYYVVAAALIAQIVGGIVLLYAKVRHSPRRYGIIFPLILTAILVTCVVGFILRIPFFHGIDTTILTSAFALLFFETCFLTGMIPVNTNYRKLFRNAGLKLQITDRGGSGVLLSNDTETLTDEQWADISEQDTVTADENTLMKKSRITGGYAIWSEDITFINKIKAKIAESSREVEAANAMLSLEANNKERDTRDKTRLEIYAAYERDIAVHEQQLAEMLRSTPADETERAAHMGAVAALVCYIKRRSNLLVLEMSGSETITFNVYVTYIDELAELAQMAGVNCMSYCSLVGDIRLRHAVLFYDFFHYAIRHAAASKGAGIVAQTASGNGILAMKLMVSGVASEYELPAPLSQAIESASGTFAKKDLDDDTTGLFLSFNVED